MTAADLATRTEGLAIGRGALRALHTSLQNHAPAAAIAVLQEAGFASGEGVYQTFTAWLPAGAGVESAEQLDGRRLSQVLSAFFEAHGWGPLSVTPLRGGALALDSEAWAEADSGTADAPMCFFSAGMLADFLGRLSGEAVAVMEVECRCRGDERCRFLSAMPDTLQRVYEAMTAGKNYEDALTGA